MMGKINIEIDFEDIEKIKELITIFSKYIPELSINESLQNNKFLKIEDMDFKIRVRNCLKAENIRTVNDLLNYGSEWKLPKRFEHKLARMPNLGKKSICEIKEELYKLSLWPD